MKEWIGPRDLLGQTHTHTQRLAVGDLFVRIHYNMSILFPPVYVCQGEEEGERELHRIIVRDVKRENGEGVKTRDNGGNGERRCLSTVARNTTAPPLALPLVALIASHWPLLDFAWNLQYHVQFVLFAQNLPSGSE